MKDYTLEELFAKSESELLEILKSKWNFSKEDQICVFGKLKEIPSKNSGSFFILEKFRHPVLDVKLSYPCDEISKNTGIHVRDPKHFNISDPAATPWVKAVVKLSPLRDRKNRNNPFHLTVVKMDSLAILPEFDVSKSSLTLNNFIEDDLYIEEYLYKHHLKKIQEHLQDEVEKQIDNQKKLIVEIDKKNESIKLASEKAKTEYDDLLSKTSESQVQLKELKSNVEKYRKLFDRAETQYSDFIKNLEITMAKLNEMIEEKSEILKKLELVDENDINNISFNFEKPDDRDGHDFEKVFQSNHSEAIAYIQSYMWNKNIVYKRSILEDFFALITTHDLIVLAGDSGSGKTNLVKSFAKAIGGKAIIVPVKPNWTSAEDLLGYYNPLENKYLSTKFLDALLEAQRNPHTPYFICLDEMNLARVEYYFADFLSLLEERDSQPEIQLFSTSEGKVLASELKHFIELVNDTTEKLNKNDLDSFVDILKDEEFNEKLQTLCGFQEGESLLKYHSYLKKMINSFINTPSTIKLPKNVRIIGAINVDETTHYLSPKILDRAHIMKFSSPLLQDWSKVESEILDFDIDVNLPVKFSIDDLGNRKPYPVFDRNELLVQDLVELVKDYLDPLGIEFGLRTIRQALGYSDAMKSFDVEYPMILNNIVLHKVLPKLLFDGEKNVDDVSKRKDILMRMNRYLANKLEILTFDDDSNSSISELNKLIKNAEANDWVVNYWSR